MRIFTADREAGNIIDEFATIEAAKKAIEQYESDDILEGTFTENFYDVVDENNCSLLD